ncbi:MAG: very short patch repair endonuclease [Verrucomicrobia bacterium]|nr:very short patch repair endonuclease [Verrucomicrobiota bacterium]
MPDVFTPAKRSHVMSLIRSTGNAATEMRLVALLRAEKITGWRRHLSLPMPHTSRLRSSPGSAPTKGKPKAKTKAKPRTTAPAHARQRRPRVRPDFVFRQERVVIFVDGCFWHGCPRHATRPRQNRKFWDEKIARNQKRDRLVTRELRRSGWTVLRLWECALAPRQQARTLGRLRRALGL